MPAVEPRPRSSAYVGMLALTAFAMFLGVAVLALECNEYDWASEATAGPTIAIPAVPSPEPATPAAK